MQGFRPFGHGGPYPLPSNLSPLAPPFTVGPYFGSRIGTNSLAGDPFYGEPYYDPTCVTQPGTVPWPRPSSPTCLSDPFPTGVNNGASSIHPGVGPPFNQFMSTFDNFMSTFPGPESYNRHVNPQVSSSRVVPDRNTSLNASERGDVLPAPTAPSDAFWNANAKSGTGQSKVGAPSYASFANQGVSAVDIMQASAEPSNVWAGKSAVSIAETSSVEPQNTDLLLGRLSSKFEENSKNAPIDMSKTSVMYPTSRPEKPSYEKPSYQRSSPDVSSEPWNHTDPRLYNADPKYGSHNIDPLGFYPVFPFSSNYQTYEPPSINNPLTHTNGSLFNFDQIVRPTDTCDAKVPSACYISSGTGYIHANAERSEVYSDASSSDNGVEESDRARVDPSMLDASEILEQFNPGVDSPCWKGASDSQYSLFGAAEAGLPHIPAEISGFNNFNLQGSHNHPPKSDNVVEVSSSQGSGKCIGKDSSASFLKQTSPIVCSLPGSTGGGSHLEPSQTVKAGVISRQPICEDRNADIGVDSKHATLFGSTLPSRSNVPLFDLNVPKLHDGPLDNFTGSKFSKSQALVNSMLVMSEMLLSYCTEDFGALKEQDHGVIQQVVQNLDGCVFLTGSTSSVSKTKFLRSETANSSEKQTNGHKGTEVAQSKASNTEEKGGQNACEEKKNSSMFSMKDSSPLRTIPVTDQELEQEDMTKGIQKILEENFHDDDEPDSQGLLYKNLWLEAEAALCSLKYKERFARMKIGMQKSQNPTEKGKEPVDLDKLSSNKATLAPKNDSLFESSSDESEESEESDETGDSEETEETEDSNDSINGEVPEALEENLDQSTTTEDDNASVMARFRILKSRIERTSSMNKEDKPHDLIDARFRPGSKGSLHNVSMQIAEDNAVKQQSIANDLSFPGRENGWPFIKSHFTPHVTEQGELEFGPMQSAPKAHIVTDQFVTGECGNRAESGATQSAAATNIMVDKFSTRECSSPSSEWEHVLKDAEWPA